MLFRELGKQLEGFSVCPQPLEIEEICWYAAKTAIAAQLMDQKVIFPRIVLKAAPIVI